MSGGADEVRCIVCGVVFITRPGGAGETLIYLQANQQVDMIGHTTDGKGHAIEPANDTAEVAVKFRTECGGDPWFAMFGGKDEMVMEGEMGGGHGGFLREWTFCRKSAHGGKGGDDRGLIDLSRPAGTQMIPLHGIRWLHHRLPSDALPGRGGCGPVGRERIVGGRSTGTGIHDHRRHPAKSSRGTLLVER